MSNDARLQQIRNFNAVIKAADDSLVVYRRADVQFLLTLADALARLVETEPLGNLESLDYCAYCASVLVDYTSVRHAINCPWLQARELLATRVET